MITIKHPKEECNLTAEKYLVRGLGELRRLHELMLPYGNITYRYHLDARRTKPTEQEYKEWLDGLPNNVRKGMDELGFENCKTILSFIRYVMEKDDIGMEEYIRMHMDPEEYAEYSKLFK